MKEEGFDAGDAEFEAWWEAKGHSLALAKAKTARHSTVEAVKCGVWLAHGASRHARIRHGLTLARSWHKGPTHTRAGGGLRQEAQGVRRFAGGSATALAVIQAWSTITDDIYAPWRQTGGGGGSEFGKVKWLTALKVGFKTTEEPPRFKLWQLALADQVVRLA